MGDFVTYRKLSGRRDIPARLHACCRFDPRAVDSTSGGRLTSSKALQNREHGD